MVAAAVKPSLSKEKGTMVDVIKLSHLQGVDEDTACLHQRGRKDMHVPSANLKRPDVAAAQAEACGRMIVADEEEPAKEMPQAAIPPREARASHCRRRETEENGSL